MDAERDPYDELTALFMTDAGDDAAFGKAEPGMDFELVGGGDPLDVDGNDAEAPLPMRVTVAMCGHLPVMAGLWVTQYADRVAEACGATALLRLEGGRCSLELFRPGRASAGPLLVFVSKKRAYLLSRFPRPTLPHRRAWTLTIEKLLKC